MRIRPLTAPQKHLIEILSKNGGVLRSDDRDADGILGSTIFALERRGLIIVTCADAGRCPPGDHRYWESVVFGGVVHS